MPNYLVTLPGQLRQPPAGDDLSHLNDLLEEHDPRGVDGAELWTVYNQSARFELRLTVQAETPEEATAKATTVAASALVDKGFTRLTAELDYERSEVAALG